MKRVGNDKMATTRLVLVRHVDAGKSTLAEHLIVVLNKCDTVTDSGAVDAYEALVRKSPEEVARVTG